MVSICLVFKWLGCPVFKRHSKTNHTPYTKTGKTWIIGLAYIKALKNMPKTNFMKNIQNCPKNSQMSKSPKQKIGHQMIQNVAKMAINCQIWQHCLRSLLPLSLDCSTVTWASVRCIPNDFQESCISLALMVPSPSWSKCEKACVCNRWKNSATVISS